MVVTWNPSDKSADITLSNGDLTASATVSSRQVRATLSRSSGKYYFEAALTATGTPILGLIPSTSSLDTFPNGVSDWWVYGNNVGEIHTAHNGSFPLLATYTKNAGDVYRVAVDLTAGKLWFGLNGVWLGGGNPAAGTGPVYTSVSGTLFPAWGTSNTCSADAHFSIDTCAFPIPSGFTAWDDVTDSGSRVCAVTGGVAVAVSRGAITGNSPVALLATKLVTVSRGALKTTFAYPLLGVSAAVDTGILQPSAGNAPVTVPLVGTLLSVVPGVITPTIAAGLAGVQSTAAAGALTSVLAAPLVPTSLGVTSGAIFPEIGGANPQWALVGKNVAVERGELGVPDPFIALIPATAVSISTGFLVATASVSVGVTTSTLNPTVTTTAVNNRNPAGYSYVGAFSFQSNFLPTGEGKLAGSGETVYNGYYVSPAVAGRYHHEINQAAEATTYSTTPYYSSGEFNNFGGSYSTYGTYRYDFAPPNSYGGRSSVGLDGSVWSVITRAYGRIDGDMATPDVLHMLQGPSGWYGGAIQRLGINVGTAGPLGLYAHDSENIYIFYSVTDGTNYFPAYRRYVGVHGFDFVVAEFGAEVQLTSFTGNATVTALSNSMCVTRSGYSSTIYLTYESGTGHIGLIVMDAVTEVVTSHTLTAVVTPATQFICTNERHLSKVPTRSMSEVAVLSSGTSVTQFLIAAAFTPRIVRLSWTAGTYTAPTMTLKAGPTDASLAGGLESLEIRGDQVFHVLYRYHEGFLSGPDRATFDYQLQVNDATGTGNSWTLSDQIWEWIVLYDIGNADSIPSLHFSGFGDGYKTLLCLVPQSRYDYYPNYDMGWAYLDFWKERYTLLSVPTICKVGRVTVSLDAIVPAGKDVTVSTGTLSSSASVLVPLAGVQLSVGRGSITALVGNAVADLTSKSTTVQIGVLACTISQALAGKSVTAQPGLLASVLSSALTGHSVLVSPGLLAPTISLTLTLTGIQTSVQSGVLGATLSITLGGKSVVVQPGTPAWRMAVALLGQSARVDRGNLTPNIQILLGTSALSLSTGALSIRLQYTLGGYPLAIARGAFSIRADCNSYPGSVWTIGQVGVDPTSTNVPPVRRRYYLWARTAVADLVADVTDEKLHARTKIDSTFVDTAVDDVHTDEEPIE